MEGARRGRDRHSTLTTHRVFPCHYLWLKHKSPRSTKLLEWGPCALRYAARLPLTAFGPFGLSATSKVTLSPSRSSSNETPTSSLEWKKRSFSCPSRLMNPNPLSVRRAIVPVCIAIGKNVLDKRSFDLAACDARKCEHKCSHFSRYPRQTNPTK